MIPAVYLSILVCAVCQVFLEESNNPLSDFAIGYEDYLQCPLQPLMDNLESQTYEIFEKCPVKYSQYQVRRGMACEQSGAGSLSLGM